MGTLARLLSRGQTISCNSKKTGKSTHRPWRPRSFRQHNRFSSALDKPVGVFVEGFEAEVVDQALRLRDVLGGDQRFEF